MIDFFDIYVPESVKPLFDFLSAIEGCIPIAANLTDENPSGWSIQVRFSENKEGWDALLPLIRIFSYHNIEFLPYVFGSDPYTTFGLHSNTKEAIEIVKILEDKRHLYLQ